MTNMSKAVLAGLTQGRMKLCRSDNRRYPSTLCGVDEMAICWRVGVKERRGNFIGKIGPVPDTKKD